MVCVRGGAEVLTRAKVRKVGKGCFLQWPFSRHMSWLGRSKGMFLKSIAFMLCKRGLAL